MDHDVLTLINDRSPQCIVQRLKADRDEALSTFAFNFNLRRYNTEKYCGLKQKTAKVGRCRLTL
jgi:hypothetical protein